MKRILTLLALLLLAASVSAQVPVDVEVGYRWTDVEGSEDVYRTQINERDGLLLRALRLQMNDFRIDASDLGAGPAGALRIEARGSDLWKLDVRFRQADAFNSHPGFALGQHTLDRTRTNFDVDLEFLPGRKITPFVGYSHGTYEGPGTTTYALGQDEFLLDSDLDETEREIRAGFGFNTGRFFGVVTQGWRNLEAQESLTLFEGAGGGNNPGNVIGRPVTATGITRESNFDVSTPFTNIFVTAQALPKLRVIGDYSRFSAEGDGDELEGATGSFASFRLSRFFTGFEDTVSSRAENETWRGGLRAEYSLTDTVDVIAAWRTEERQLDGAAAFHTIFRDTVNFGGADPRAVVEEIFDAESALERGENIWELGFAARQLGPFSVRASYSRTNEDVTLSPDLEEIVIDGPEQRGEYERTIDTIDAVGAFGKGGFNASLALRRDRSDDSILRTDFADRDRVRLRASYLFRKMLRVGALVENIDHENEDSQFDSELRHYGADAEFMFRERFRIRGAWSRFDADASALIRRPENFAIEEWTYAEDGESLEAGFSLFVKPVTVDADFTRYDNEGDNTFDLDRTRVRVVWDVVTRAAIAAEWSRDQYDETLFPTANYKASRYGLYLRWRQ